MYEFVHIEVTLYHETLVKLAKMILRYIPKCDNKVHGNVHIWEIQATISLLQDVL